MMRRMLLGAAVLLAGCYDSSFGERELTAEPEPSTNTIGELRARF